MKKIFYTSAFMLATFAATAQTFWTEDFGTGCNRAQLASAYTGTNGTWGSASSGANGTYANTWYISSANAGTGAGNCSSSCVTANVMNGTLHVSNVNITIPSFVNVGADTGASYFSGGFCSFGYCANTDMRAESPLINCTGKTNISLSFVYLENGDLANDDASLQFSADGGVTWSTIDPLAKTTGCAAGQWTAFTITLPATANNNANVKIGFHWVNNDDGAGSDPSFSVDDITLTNNPSGISPIDPNRINVFVNDHNEIVIESNGINYKMIAITDMMGRNLQYTLVNNRITLTDAPEGVYVVSIDLNGEHIVKKVLMH
ncbi:MAG: choice-of-anchor J domain-containing protein [Bacteroidetes bacterium]|nr:choice-of-anchor J domain-containing protein [Bacteroidota bacterium]